MSAMVSQITGVSIICSADCSGQIKENIKAPRYWTLWVEVTGGFPSQRANNAENVSIWSCHHGLIQRIRTPLTAENSHFLRSGSQEAVLVMILLLVMDCSYTWVSHEGTILNCVLKYRSRIWIWQHDIYSKLALVPRRLFHVCASTNTPCVTCVTVS